MSSEAGRIRCGITPLTMPSQPAIENGKLPGGGHVAS
jgi:hypothetical protein